MLAHRLRPLASLALVVAGPGSLARAQEVAERAVDAQSGHVYLRTREPLSVYDALEVARAAGGTLVAVDSAEEETFLLDNFGAREPYWIGLVFPFERWSTGAAAGFAHWASGQPDGGAHRPFVLMNWSPDAPGSWGSTSGDSARDRFRGLIELAGGDTRELPALAPRKSVRGALLLAVQGLSAKDLQNPRNASLNDLWKRSAWTFDAGTEPLADPLASLGMLVWGVGSARSALTSADPGRADHWSNENLLTRLEEVRPEITTVWLGDDPGMTGVLVDGRIDVRVPNASARKPGAAANAVRAALTKPTPLAVVATWTELALPGGEEPAESAHAKAIGEIDREIGALLSALRARPDFAAEEWWIALAGITPPPPPKKGKPELDPRARTAVPVCIVQPGLAPHEILGDVALVDLGPSLLAHLGVVALPAWQLDGRALDFARTPPLGKNLLVNGDAEAQVGLGRNGGGGEGFPLVLGWRTLAPFRIGRSVAREPAPPDHGASRFEGTGGPRACIEQTIELAPLAEDVDQGRLRFRLSGWLGGRKSGPKAQGAISCAVAFLNEQQKELARATLGPVGINERRTALGQDANGIPLDGLFALEAAGKVPKHARLARVTLSAEGLDSVANTLADQLALVLERAN